MIRVMIFGFCVNYDKNLRGLNEMALILHVMNAKYCMIDNNLFLVNDYCSLPVRLVCNKLFRSKWQLRFIKMFLFNGKAMESLSESDLTVKFKWKTTRFQSLIFI